MVRRRSEKNLCMPSRLVLQTCECRHRCTKYLIGTTAKTPPPPKPHFIIPVKVLVLPSLATPLLRGVVHVALSVQGLRLRILLSVPFLCPLQLPYLPQTLQIKLLLPAKTGHGFRFGNLGTTLRLWDLPLLHLKELPKCQQRAPSLLPFCLSPSPLHPHPNTYPLLLQPLQYPPLTPLAGLLRSWLGLGPLTAVSFFSPVFRMPLFCISVGTPSRVLSLLESSLSFIYFYFYLVMLILNIKSPSSLPFFFWSHFVLLEILPRRFS